MRWGANVRLSRVLMAAVAVLCLALPAPGKQTKRSQQKRQAGSFDYYVLSLSWSPQHCATTSRGRKDRQCRSTRPYGFVLHGFWPQYESGFPQSCATSQDLPRDVVEQMLDIMPSPGLVRHEWEKHGTCSGLTPEEYFEKSRAAFTSVKIPERYEDPADAFQTSVREIERAFRAADPRIDASEIAVLCRGKFLQEIRVCMDKRLHVRDCGRDVRDSCGGSITVRPVK